MLELLELVRLCRDDLRALLEGDMVFCKDDGDDDDDSGDDADDSQADDSDDDESQADDDDRSGSGGDDDGDDDEPISKEKARQLRSENRNLRKRAKTAEEKTRELESKDLSDKERAERERDDERKRVEELGKKNRSLSVQLAATKVGIRPNATKAAASLIDWDDVDAEDDTAVRDALRALKKDHGYLFGKTDGADGGARDRKDDKDDDEVRPGVGRLRKAYASKT